MARMQAGSRAVGPRALASAAVDFGLVIITSIAMFWVRFLPASGQAWITGAVPASSLRQHAIALVSFAVMVVLCCKANGEYRSEPIGSPAQHALATAKSVFFATLLTTSVLYIAHAQVVSRLVICSVALTNLVTLSASRYVNRKYAERRLAAGYGSRNALIVGTHDLARKLAEYLDANPKLGFVVKGLLGDTCHSDVLGAVSELPRLAREEFADVVFVVAPSERETVRRIAVQARQLNLTVKFVPELYDGLSADWPVQFIGRFPVRVLYKEPVPELALMMKRATDIVISGVVLLVSAPILAAIAVAIKVDSSGPVFYRSARVGKKGRIFTCYKFRTMISNAEQLRKKLAELNEREGILFKIREDPRITRVGRWLRKYSIDEFPQFWNVLKGDMSVVGPRPPIPDEVHQYQLEHLRRLDVQPGLTGLWQVTARQDPSFERYISLDLEYIERWSWLLDLKLILKTIPAVLRGTGA